jgi:hypothetical protein
MQIYIHVVSPPGMSSKPFSMGICALQLNLGKAPARSNWEEPGHPDRLADFKRFLNLALHVN